MELAVVSHDDDVLRLKMSGRIVQDDLEPESDPFGDLLGDKGYTQLTILNMDEVEFIDTSGLSWLLVRHKRFREQGGKLAFYSIPPIVMDVLQLLRLDLVLDVAEDETAALDMVR